MHRIDNRRIFKPAATSSARWVLNADSDNPIAAAASFRVISLSVSIFSSPSSSRSPQTKDRRPPYPAQTFSAQFLIIVIDFNLRIVYSCIIASLIAKIKPPGNRVYVPAAQKTPGKPHERAV